jgi:hypothetical protein
MVMGGVQVSGQDDWQHGSFYVVVQDAELLDPPSGPVSSHWGPGVDSEQLEPVRTVRHDHGSGQWYSRDYGDGKRGHRIARKYGEPERAGGRPLLTKWKGRQGSAREQSTLCQGRVLDQHDDVRALSADLLAQFSRLSVLGV